ncbi:MAG: nucleotidyltransferase domain-containing protein [Planctomycetota bacterium]|jgi:predicted nucleotidyltransferase
MNMDCEKLAHAVQSACPEAVFALLHGSAKDGHVKEGSDLDIALFLKSRSTWDIYRSVYEAIQAVAGDVEPDVGILNNAEPVYCFEALKGNLLFCRDKEAYIDFFSKTCRRYEYQIADYERQHRYRLEAMKT